MTSKHLSKSLNQGLRWYSQNLKSASLDYAGDLNKLLNAVNPLTLNEIQELCELDPKRCPRYTLNQLKKADLLKMLETSAPQASLPPGRTGPCPDNIVVASAPQASLPPGRTSKIPHTPSVTKAQLIESLLTHPKSKTKLKQTGGNIRTGNKRTGSQSRRYDDLGAKTLALLKLEKYAKIFHLLPNKKLPLTTQNAIKQCVGHLKPIYQTGGATLPVPVPVADPIIIATAIGGVLLLTIIAIGMFKLFKSPPDPGSDSTPLLETPAVTTVEPERISTRTASLIESLLNSAADGNGKAFSALANLATTNRTLKALIMKDHRYQRVAQFERRIRRPPV